MAPVFNVLRTCGLIVYFILNVHATQNNSSGPWILSVEVNEKTCVQTFCKYLLNVRGGQFLGHHSWRLTPREGGRGNVCDVWSPSYDLREVKTEEWDTIVEISVPFTDGKIFFCLHHPERNNSPFGGQWLHQGGDLFLDPKSDDVSQKIENAQTTTGPPPNTAQKGNLEEISAGEWADLSHDTDVNRLPNVPRPTRDESKDVEVLIRDQYIPLNDIDPNDLRTVLRDGRSSVKDRGYEAVVKDSRNKPMYISSRYAIQKPDTDGNTFSNVVNREKRSLNEDIVQDYGSKTREMSMSKTSDELVSSQDIMDAKLELENAIKPRKIEENHEDALIRPRKARQATTPDGAGSGKEPIWVKIEGLRVEDADKEPKIIEESIPSVLADTSVTLRLFGEGLTTSTVIAFSYETKAYGEQCKFLLRGEYMVKEDSVEPRTALFHIRAPTASAASKLYICAKNLREGVSDPSKDEDKYQHQGSEHFKILAIHNKLLPLWVSITLILICLMFSALFSGLNLGLMSLDRTELKIISNTGTEQERKYARAIMPVRDHGNYLLCSILLGNVAVNSTFTILLDELTSGLFAVIFSTLSIVLLGEITPQAICSRHGLMVGAKSIMVTKAVMALTAPLAFPVSKLLDYFLGEEIGNVYNRERLKELVKVTTGVNDLDKDEVNIISGALELRKKHVCEVMTRLEDAFMLPITSVLDFETMSEIVKSGFSRIPVFEVHRGNIVTVLFIKDLAFVDPDDNTPLRTLVQYYQNPCNFVFEDVTLDVMFRQFKDGHKGHMAFVHRINNEGEGDPFYETIGLVTLEDVIEEMIQAEIVDETDVFMDNRTKRRRNRPLNKLQDFAAFAERHENQRIHISPQLTLATFQFLSSSVDAFRPDAVSETVLRRMLKQDVMQHIKLKGKDKRDPATFVFQQGKPVDYFVLILEGRVEVTVGRENLVFEAGPFTYFGVQALTQNVGVAESPTPSAKGSLQNINMDSMLRHTFVPDYSVRAVTDVFYLTVKRSLYLAAKRATLMEKGALSKGATNEQFDTEVDKHLTVSSSSNLQTSLTSKKLLTKSSSAASASDDVASTCAAYKLSSPRLNIIELMQISPQPNYESSELDESDKCSTNASNRLTNSWPNTDLGKRFSNSFDHSVANKWNGKKPFEETQTYKKKKATFHTDSSLLTFHSLSPDEEPKTCRSCDEHEMISYERDTIPYERDAIPYERDTVPYERDAIPYERDTIPNKRAPIPYERDTVFFEHENDHITIDYDHLNNKERVITGTDRHIAFKSDCSQVNQQCDNVECNYVDERDVNKYDYDTTRHDCYENIRDNSKRQQDVVESDHIVIYDADDSNKYDCDTIRHKRRAFESECTLYHSNERTRDENKHHPSENDGGIKYERTTDYCQRISQEPTQCKERDVRDGEVETLEGDRENDENICQSVSREPTQCKERDIRDGELETLEGDRENDENICQSVSRELAQCKERDIRDGELETLEGDRENDENICQSVSWELAQCKERYIRDGELKTLEAELDNDHNEYQSISRDPTQCKERGIRDRVLNTLESERENDDNKCQSVSREPTQCKERYIRDGELITPEAELDNDHNEYQSISRDPSQCKERDVRDRELATLETEHENDENECQSVSREPTQGKERDIRDRELETFDVEHENECQSVSWEPIKCSEERYTSQGVRDEVERHLLSSDTAERIYLERQRVEMERQVLAQLSRILRILERKDQT